MDEQQLEGVWTYVQYEAGEDKRSPQAASHMAKMVLLAEDSFSGWNGLWAIVIYGYQGRVWAESEVKDWCRASVLEGYRSSATIDSDLYQYTGGRFKIAPHKFPKEIDFEPFAGGIALADSAPGIYTLDNQRLTICIGPSEEPRPVEFSGKERRMLGVLQQKFQVEAVRVPNSTELKYPTILGSRGSERSTLRGKLKTILAWCTGTR